MVGGAYRRSVESPVPAFGVAVWWFRNPVAKKMAIFAIAHTLIVIIWHVLVTDTPYADLGAEFYQQRVDPERETRRLIAKLEALGHKVTLEPAA